MYQLTYRDRIKAKKQARRDLILDIIGCLVLGLMFGFVMVVCFIKF